MRLSRASIWVFSLNFAAIAAAITIYYQGGRDPFGERGFITFLSSAQLLAIAGLNYQIFRVKKAASQTAKPSAHRLWQLLALGFVFLAADEFFAIHEVTDLFIHDVFHLEETVMTDRIDDVIVGLYGLVGLAMVWTHRREFFVSAPAINFLKTGFGLMGVMVLIDFMTNDQLFFYRFFQPTTAEFIDTALYNLEDSLKILAEASLILAFYSILIAVNAHTKRLEGVKGTFQPERESVKR